MKNLMLIPLFALAGCNSGETAGAEPAERKADPEPSLELQERLNLAETRYQQLKADAESMRVENESLRARIAELENGAPQLLRKAIVARDENLDRAVALLTQLVAEFPVSDEAGEAQRILDQLLNEKSRQEKEEQDRREAEEKARRLGIKGLKASRNLSVGNVTFTLNDASLKGRWVFDRYPGSYHYQEPTRGNMFVVADFAISSSETSVKLPPVYVYRASSDGTLEYQCRMDIKFYRWSDFGSYLGNYSDYRNDFAHTKKIRFSGACRVDEATAKAKALFILVGNTPCFVRQYERFRQPPVFYTWDHCPIAPDTLDATTLEPLMQVSAVLNRRRL